MFLRYSETIMDNHRLSPTTKRDLFAVATFYGYQLVYLWHPVPFSAPCTTDGVEKPIAYLVQPWILLSQLVCKTRSIWYACLDIWKQIVKTRGYSNGSIRPHRSQLPLTVGDLGPLTNTCFHWTHESTTRTASWSVQPFMQGSRS